MSFLQQLSATDGCWPPPCGESIEMLHYSFIGAAARRRSDFSDRERGTEMGWGRGGLGGGPCGRAHRVHGERLREDFQPLTAACCRDPAGVRSRLFRGLLEPSFWEALSCLVSPEISRCHAVLRRTTYPLSNGFLELSQVVLRGPHTSETQEHRQTIDGSM